MMKSKKRRRKNKKLKHSPFAVALDNCFMNLRGQFSCNLDTSKSKAAILLREQKSLVEEKKNTRRQLQGLKDTLKLLEKKQTVLLAEAKAAMNLPAEDKVKLYERSAALVQAFRQTRRQIANCYKVLNG